MIACEASKLPIIVVMNYCHCWTLVVTLFMKLFRGETMVAASIKKLGAEQRPLIYLQEATQGFLLEEVHDFRVAKQLVEYSESFQFLLSL